jgi:hypothetical protein
VPGPLRPDAPALPGERGRPRVASGRRASRARELRLPVAVGGVGLSVVTYLGVSDPYRPGSHLLCPFLALTGLYCAGCGGQRAVHSLAHGDLATAWDLNPLAVLLAPLAVVAWGTWSRRRWRAAGSPRTVVPVPSMRVKPSTWLLVVVVVAFAVLRNVPPLAPWLAP